MSTRRTNSAPSANSGHRARRTPRKKTLAWLSGLAVVAAAAVIPFTASGAEGGSDYVALGDSYSAGTGADPYLSNDATIPPVDTLTVNAPPTSVNHNNNCQRSDKAYSALLAKEEGDADGFISSYTFAACAGAVSQDVRDRQLTVLNDQTDVVTLTIGGNDVKFARAMELCVALPDITGACAIALNESLSIMENDLQPRLEATYNEILAAAPNLRNLVVIGYPELFDLDGACTVLEDVFNPSPLVRSEMNRAAAQLNQVIKDAVSAVGGIKLRFLNPQPAYADHEICSAESFLTEPVDTPAIGDSYHPNAKGHAELKKLVLRVLRT
ncbi:SGNH/GDSL hydrolase family protein [Streptomyces sp. NBC_00286]|uniref:SGNH/GDSL hydrolase family protein n=1 Tax=Streptomyces sp. NBC_00286 TaxID=2975701 RepID=UPI002E2E8103|nr:SGNH/GDSL hydrolase family protein [Streptomyces sp. NBC_00286]